jgi:hypothetical protein
LLRACAHEGWRGAGAWRRRALEVLGFEVYGELEIWTGMGDAIGGWLDTNGTREKKKKMKKAID